MKNKKTFVDALEAGDPIAHRLMINFMNRDMDFDDFMEAVIEYLEDINNASGNSNDYDAYDRAMRGI